MFKTAIALAFESAIAVILLIKLENRDRPQETSDRYQN